MIKKILLILLLPSMFLVAQTNLNNKYRLGKTYEQSNKLLKAKSIFEEIVKVAPNNTQYANSLNEIYLKLKEYDNSINFLLERIKLRPKDVSLYGMLGATYYISGNTKKAVLAWDKGISLNNNSQVNYSVISNYAIQNRAFEIAINYLKEGKEKTTSKIQFSYQLAQIYSYTMNYTDAAEEYCIALIEQPSQLQYIRRRMETYLSAVGALEQTISVVEKYSDNSTIIELLSFLYIRNNQLGKAFELIKELDKSKENDGILIYNFANDSYRSSNFDISSDAFKYLIENHHNSKYEPNSRIGFAKTLEAKLDLEWKKNQQLWKSVYTTDTTGAFKYLPILETYKSIIPTVKGDLKNEALFRIGKIYTSKFFELETGIKYFEKIIANSNLSIYYGRANFEISKIELILNNLEKAKKKLQSLFTSSRTEKVIKARAKFLLAEIEFYQSNFDGSLSVLANINKDLSNDLANDAIELSMLINMGRRDSLNLVIFAKAELETKQHNYLSAEKRFKELSENKNLFFLKNISRIKYAQLLITQNKYPTAIEVLKELSETKEMNIFADKSFYLLAQVYEFGIVDKHSAISTYEKFLELFPNSLYLEKAQTNLKRLKNNKSENI